MPLNSQTWLTHVSPEEANAAYVELKAYFDELAKRWGDGVAVAALQKLDHSILMERYQVETGVIARQ